MNTENTELWYEAAETWENDFVVKYGDRFKIIINPAKKYNKYAPDLYCLNTCTNADLKPQFTPFYKAFELYGVNPQYAWTFNVSDLLEYLIQWENDLGIFVWVKFEDSNLFGVEISKCENIYFVKVSDLKKLLNKKKIIHKYGKRINDARNEHESFIIDLRESIFKKVI